MSESSHEIQQLHRIIDAQTDLLLELRGLVIDTMIWFSKAHQQEGFESSSKLLTILDSLLYVHHTGALDRLH